MWELCVQAWSEYLISRLVLPQSDLSADAAANLLVERVEKRGCRAPTTVCVFCLIVISLTGKEQDSSVEYVEGFVHSFKKDNNVDHCCRFWVLQVLSFASLLVVLSIFSSIQGFPCITLCVRYWAEFSAVSWAAPLNNNTRNNYCGGIKGAKLLLCEGEHQTPRAHWINVGITYSENNLTNVLNVLCCNMWVNEDMHGLGNMRTQKKNETDLI